MIRLRTLVIDGLPKLMFTIDDGRIMSTKTKNTSNKKPRLRHVASNTLARYHPYQASRDKHSLSTYSRSAYYESKEVILDSAFVFLVH